MEGRVFAGSRRLDGEQPLERIVWIGDDPDDNGWALQDSHAEVPAL
ncbi:MAG: hypothetical protein H7146_07550 [Burkholderiaceae bacterium]|nr:hypothetical protein [Microbacteriaceae bacterium]